METKNLICIQCPLGCPLTVTLEGKEIVKVVGNTCKRGEAYGKKEITAPTRTVTSTVKLTGGKLPVVAVKTRTDIPKEKIFACMAEINGVCVEAPVPLGTVVIENVAGTGVAVVTTANGL